MKKLLTALATAALLASGLVSPASASTKDASAGASRVAALQQDPRTVCQEGSGTQSGRCWKLLESRSKLVVVEAIPLENKTRRKKSNMHCSFSRPVSRSVTVGGSVSASAEFGVFKVVKANITVTVHRDVTQTASQASTAGGSVVLKPGESVVCQRTYGYVWARVKQYTWSGGRDAETIILKSKVPANLGVRIVD